MTLLVSQLNELKIAHQEDGNIRRCAEKTGISYDIARRALLEAGVYRVSKNASLKKREKILRLCGEGAAARDIAKAVGLSDHSVRRILRAAGMKLRKSRHFRTDTDDLGRVSDAEIAEREGVSRQAIRQRRERRGIPPYRGGG